MLTGFGHFGAEESKNGVQAAPAKESAIPMLGQVLLSDQQPQMCRTGTTITGESTKDYCLSSKEYLDNQKLINIGIGAAVGIAVGGLAVYLITR